MITVFPLAVYTADHGLAWNYPKAEISYAALDRCRTAFGRLPDFDAGDPGFEGVLIEADRIFAVRCWSVSHRDFRGRNATYLAATWIQRGEAPSVDFETLLAARELTQPLTDFPSFFKASAVGNPSTGMRDHPRTLPDFHAVNAVLSAMDPAETAVFKRRIGERAVSCRYTQPAAKTRVTQENPSFERDRVPVSSAPQPAPQPLSMLPTLLAISVALNILLLGVIVRPHVKARLSKMLTEQVSNSGTNTLDHAADGNGTNQQANARTSVTNGVGETRDPGSTNQQSKVKTPEPASDLGEKKTLMALRSRAADLVLKTP